MDLKTVENALRVLEHFFRDTAPVSALELAEEVGVSKSAMSRLLSALKKHEFLELDNRIRRYRLGPAAARMARAVHRSMSGGVVSVAAPYLDELRDMIGETVILEVRSGNRFYHAYVADSVNPVSLKVELGDEVKPYAHVGSKAIAAFSKPEEIDQWLHQEMERISPQTIIDPEQLQEIYAEIRRTGVAYDFGEYVEEVNAIGAPVFNHENEAVAGVVVVLVTEQGKQDREQRYIPYLKDTANRISVQLHSSRRLE